MNFIYPTTATFPEFDGRNANTECFQEEGWTRLIKTDVDSNYFEEIQNDNEKIKVRGINNVPNNTYNEAITFLALQSQCEQRQISISANGFSPGFGPIVTFPFKILTKIATVPGFLNDFILGLIS